jgi:hypothetical protein
LDHFSLPRIGAAPRHSSGHRWSDGIKNILNGK